jgi:threonine dehydrogenase-like Zn-dependent dehydrogenase
MKTKAVRIYGKNDLRLEEFELPPLGDDEILAHVVSDSICMSSHKAALQGAEHKRVPKDIAKKPTIIGHEFAGTILEVGKKWKKKFKPGAKFSIQPALNYKGSLAAPGYSYRHIGGDATHVIIPNEVMEMSCLLPFTGRGFFPASLSEPVSCIAGAFHATYHTDPGSYVHHMGIRPKGTMALLAAAGPMGLGAVDWALNSGSANCPPRLLVVTDIDNERLARAGRYFPPEAAARAGVKLEFVNTRDLPDVPKALLEHTEGEGFDDVFLFAPVRPVVETGDRILARHGCLNFFAGPMDPEFSAAVNFYNVHYNSTHLLGTTGGNNDDMVEALAVMSEGRIDPAVMVTHIGGLNAVVDTTLNLPRIPGGKKLMYTNIELELTAIADFRTKSRTDPLFRALAEIVDRHNGLWSVEAEEHLLANARPIG